MKHVPSETVICIKNGHVQAPEVAIQSSHLGAAKVCTFSCARQHVSAQRYTRASPPKSVNYSVCDNKLNKSYRKAETISLEQGDVIHDGHLLRSRGLERQRSVKPKGSHVKI